MIASANPKEKSFGYRSPQLVSIMEVEGVSDVWSCDWYPLYLINCQNLQLYDSNRNFYPLPSLVSPNLKNGFVTKAVSTRLNNRLLWVTQMDCFPISKYLKIKICFVCIF